MIRPEYPRPNLKREEWLNLNGEWDFRFENEEWQKIQVPFVYQAKNSGIGDNRPCDTIYYKRTFQTPKEWAAKDIWLHFGAVDYCAKVFLNSQYLGCHEGGSSPFSFLISPWLLGETQELVVEVWDPWQDEEIPRGKQYWLEQPDSIWYTRSSGIWQTVWLEPVHPIHLDQLWLTPDLDAGNIEVEYSLSGYKPGLVMEWEISFKEQLVCRLSTQITAANGRFIADVLQNKIFHAPVHHGGHCWSPEHPNLFDITLRLLNEEQVLDTVDSYFGMRKIEARDGMVWLNNRPYYQRLVLDQGYWPDSLLTAPDDQAFQKDIVMAKQMGFNGCRKHQKAEDPRYLYWADQLGFLVWGEVPSCPSFSRTASQRIMNEWKEILWRDYNHPSIICWVVLNESWGVPSIKNNPKQQAHSLALYYNLKSLDHTRLIVNNDGWEQTRTDICAIHNYSHGTLNDTQAHRAYQEALSDAAHLVQTCPAGRPIYANGFGYTGEPILLTEFGGINFQEENQQNWGYTTIQNGEEYLQEYGRLLHAIGASQALYGFCYTQLTDVEQETNGLLTYDRCFKVDPEKICKITQTTGQPFFVSST